MVRILVADDDQGVLDYARAQLEPLGYDIVTTDSCHHALKILQDALNQPETQSIDLLITDNVMPVGSLLEGVNLIRYVKGADEDWVTHKFFDNDKVLYRRFIQAYAQTPTILISSRITDYDKDRLEGLEKVNTLEKVRMYKQYGHNPFEEGALVAKVKECLG